MMVHAWNGYAQYAWGMNEVRPISQKPHNPGIFGHGGLGATIVDGLDTLFIMGLMDEFQKGRDWIAQHFHIESAVCPLLYKDILS